MKNQSKLNWILTQIMVQCLAINFYFYHFLLTCKVQSIFQEKSKYVFVEILIGWCLNEGYAMKQALYYYGHFYLQSVSCLRYVSQQHFPGVRLWLGS